MKLAVIGSRSIDSTASLFSALDKYKEEHDVLCLLVGGAKGADDFAARWGRANSVDTIVFRPYYMVDTQANFQVRHFFMRNKQIVDNADMVLAYWDGKSRGTRWGINYAVKRDKEVQVVAPSVYTV